MFTSLTSLACDGVYAHIGWRHLSQLFAALPALESCSLRIRTVESPSPSSSPHASHFGRIRGTGFPATLLQCTRLTSLVVIVPQHEPQDVLDWGGLPQDITALRRLAHLRLQNCLSEPITEVNFPSAAAGHSRFVISSCWPA